MGSRARDTQLIRGLVLTDDTACQGVQELAPEEVIGQEDVPSLSMRLSICLSKKTQQTMGPFRE